MSAAPPIDLTVNVQGFFRDVLAGSLRSRGCEVTDAAETYLVALLADFARPGQLDARALDRPVTLQLDEALRAAGYERFDRLRAVGDGVLYVTGFFGEHLEMRGVELGYVSGLGARAYESAAEMLRGAAGSGATGAPDLFAELADNFEALVALVADVADSLLARSATTDRSMVRLYERWLKHGSSSLAGLLAERGVLPRRGDRTLH